MTPAARRHFWLGHLGIPLLWALVLLLMTVGTEIDLRVSGWFYDAGLGYFPLGKSWLLEVIMHGYGKQLGRLLAMLAIGLWLGSFVLRPLRPWRAVLLFIVLGMATGSTLVSALKHASNVFCPWDLKVFGGDYPLQWPFAVPVVEGIRAGQCWPGGHASYGFALLALYFACRDRQRTLAWGLLVLAVLYGHLLGFGRVMQGAHFLTHQFWSALVCWFSALFWYVVILRRDYLPHLPVGRQ